MTNKTIYLVMCDEVLADGDTHTECCRAFDTDEQAQNYCDFLYTMEWSNDEEFYIQEVKLGEPSND